MRPHGYTTITRAHDHTGTRPHGYTNKRVHDHLRARVRGYTRKSYYIESRVKTPVGTVLPRLEQWPCPQLRNTTIQGGAVRGRKPLSVSKCTARGYETLKELLKNRFVFAASRPPTSVRWQPTTSINPRNPSLSRPLSAGSCQRFKQTCATNA
jgi:hypothetical protein